MRRQLFGMSTTENMLLRAIRIVGGVHCIIIRSPLCVAAGHSPAVLLL